MDESQDWFVVHGYEDDSGTTIRFRRKFITCDLNDEKIEEGTVHLIYAYHDVDPDVPNFLFRYHGQTQRGSKAVLLIGTSFQPKPWPTDAGTIDFRHNNYQIPGSDVTTYGCTAFYLPTIRAKLHIIKTEASIQRGHENLVKNILLLACRLPIFFHLPQYHGLNFNCLDGTIPLLQYCESVFAGWSVGAEPFYYPEHVGVSIGAPEDPVLYVLQTHFHNPVQQEGIIDSSGLRLTYTRQLRRFDAGILHTGYYISNRQIIPPGEPSFVTKIHCSRRCLEWGMRSVQAIRVFGVFFHTHGLGKSVKVRSVRNGTEYQHWAFDARYSPANQFYRLLSREVLVQKGDSIRIDCEYDSTSRDRVTMGGITLTDETCRVIILYYPKQAIDSCFGWSVYNKLNNEEGDIIQVSEAIRYLSSVNWTNNNVMKSNLKKAILDSDERTICFSLYQEPMIAFDHSSPESIRNEYMSPSFNCSAESP
ncbi:hypothetical protein CHS0354_013563 [Potamilus streckersoni]|uniref:DOMON domain-containing protein n=1 Tax=Potamilus streckersoni TaxID=2493646 RepID=A0AAE0SKQ8_9BIVA|nr:hypothetical protein CHS0354_013563 [Potamilus streckersoni]